MSDQEMQFADPEWQPPRQGGYTREQASASPSPVNEAPRQDTAQKTTSQEENEETDSADYSSGYRAEQPGYRYTQPQSRQRARRRRNPWSWVILTAILLAVLVFTPLGEDSILFFWRIMLAVLIAAGITAFITLTIKWGRSSISSTETHTFSVGMQPRIIIKSMVGTIRVHAGGEEHQVVVQTTKHMRGWERRDIDVGYDQSVEKNRITVKVGKKWLFLGPSSVDFDITVPRMTDLDLKTDAGSINVGDVMGQLVCIVDAGSINVNAVHLRGDSKLKTDAGVVNFSGSLDPTGSYQVMTDAGTVNVTLPEDASFRLDAKTDVGSINSDFPLSVRRVFPGGKARGDIGFAPYPSLKLRSDVGSINIRSIPNSHS